MLGGVPEEIKDSVRAMLSPQPAVRIESLQMTKVWRTPLARVNILIYKALYYAYLVKHTHTHTTPLILATLE